MKRTLVLVAAALLCVVLLSPVGAVTSSDILKRVKAAESAVRDFKAELVISDANKGAVGGMGEGYGDILRLQKGTVAYKKPGMIRYDGYAQSIKAAYIQNGYIKLIIASMIRQKVNVKDAPGKRQDTLDLGFLSSQLWNDNAVTVVSTGKDGVAKLKFSPRFGGDVKRHDNVWVDTKTLRVLKREKYLASGELRVKAVYGGFQLLGGKLPIATQTTMYDPRGKQLGDVSYKGLKSNIGLSDALFSLSQR